MTKKWTALLLAAVLAVGLSACDTSRAEAPSSNLESGVSAIEDSPIGPLYIVRTDDGQYGFLYDGIIWEACPTPQIEADNVYCRATGCAAASNLKELPHDLSEWTHVSR